MSKARYKSLSPDHEFSKLITQEAQNRASLKAMGINTTELWKEYQKHPQHAKWILQHGTTLQQIVTAGIFKSSHILNLSEEQHDFVDALQDTQAPLITLESLRQQGLSVEDIQRNLKSATWRIRISPLLEASGMTVQELQSLLDPNSIEYFSHDAIYRYRDIALSLVKSGIPLEGLCKLSKNTWPWIIENHKKVSHLAQEHILPPEQLLGHAQTLVRLIDTHPLLPIKVLKSFTLLPDHNKHTFLPSNPLSPIMGLCSLIDDGILSASYIAKLSPNRLTYMNRLLNRFGTWPFAPLQPLLDDILKQRPDIETVREMVHCQHVVKRLAQDKILSVANIASLSPAQWQHCADLNKLLAVKLPCSREDLKYLWEQPHLVRPGIKDSAPSDEIIRWIEHNQTFLKKYSYSLNEAVIILNRLAKQPSGCNLLAYQPFLFSSEHETYSSTLTRIQTRWREHVATQRAQSPLETALSSVLQDTTQRSELLKAIQQNIVFRQDTATIPDDNGHSKTVPLLPISAGILYESITAECQQAGGRFSIRFKREWLNFCKEIGIAPAHSTDFSDAQKASASALCNNIHMAMIDISGAAIRAETTLPDTEHLRQASPLYAVDAAQRDTLSRIPKQKDVLSEQIRALKTANAAKEDIAAMTNRLEALGRLETRIRHNRAQPAAPLR